MRLSDSESMPAGRRSVLLFLAFATCGSTPSFAQKIPATPQPIPVSTGKFELRAEGQSFFLQQNRSNSHTRIAIPREWLIPKEETDDADDSSPVSPYNYDRHVTSFPIGNSEIGLRFSSFDAMTEGSMALGQGKDVFLIYSPASGKLRPAGFDLGITKERIWGAGCFNAHMVHLLVADFNEDGLTDIGAVREEIWCPEAGEEDDEEPTEGKIVGKNPPELQNIAARHLYQQHLVTWYVYAPEGWKLDPQHTVVPDRYSELPLTGISLSPVDFVGQLLWRSADPKSWVDSPQYVPAYRRKLILSGAETPETQNIRQRSRSPRTSKRSRTILPGGPAPHLPILR